MQPRREPERSIRGALARCRTKARLEAGGGGQHHLGPAQLHDLVDGVEDVRMPKPPRYKTAPRMSTTPCPPAPRFRGARG